MESRDDSTHLRSHVLPPLGIVRTHGNFGGVNHVNSEKGVRQRIGTPAPRKKCPIPEDMDLSSLNGASGNPSIKVEESCKPDEMQKSDNSSENSLKQLLDGRSGLGNTNLNFRLKKRPQLEPIVNLTGVGKTRGDLNGNGINIDLSKMDLSPEKIRLPNRYAPLKPISRKHITFSETVNNP